MLSRGYKEGSIKYNLATMANRSRQLLIRGHYHKPPAMVVPSVTDLHPSTTVLSNITKQSFKVAARLDPLIDYLIPKSSLIVTYKKLPNLQLLLCKNDQNSLVSQPTPSQMICYEDTGCRCLVCKASVFGRKVRPPSMPGFVVNLSSNVNCKSGPGVVYHIVCMSGKQSYRLAYYFGRAWTNIPTTFPMHARWSNHKSHFKKYHLNCELTLSKFRKGENPQDFLKIHILETVKEDNKIVERELYGQRKLFAFWPSGLCKRIENN